MKDLIDKIFQGDILEILKSLPDDCIDMGVTSPPYNKGEKHKGWLVKNVLYDKALDKKQESLYQKRVIKPGVLFSTIIKCVGKKELCCTPLLGLVKQNG